MRLARKDVVQCLVMGFQVMEIRWFPDIKYRVFRKRNVLTWNFNNYVELYLEAGTPSVHAVTEAISGDIATEIEHRSLSYSRNVARYREYGLPWLVHCLAHLPQGLEDGQQLKILTFLSCICMIQNGDYVSYKELPPLIQEMGISQAELQRLKIQFWFLMPKVRGISGGGGGPIL